VNFEQLSCSNFFEFPWKIWRKPRVNTLTSLFLSLLSFSLPLPPLCVDAARAECSSAHARAAAPLPRALDAPAPPRCCPTEHHHHPTRASTPALAVPLARTAPHHERSLRLHRRAAASPPAHTLHRHHRLAIAAMLSRCCLAARPRHRVINACACATAPLAANALLPSHTRPVFPSRPHSTL
jgi:hypothetical protein